MAYLVVQPISKNGDQVVLGGFGRFGAANAVLPAAQQGDMSQQTTTAIVKDPCASARAVLEANPSFLSDCGLEPSCPACEATECPECPEYIEPLPCPDCPAPELKAEGSGIAWWWLLVAGAAGVGAGYYAAKKL